MPASIRPWLIAKRRAEEAALGAQLFNDPSSFDPLKVARAAGDFSDAMTFLNQLRALDKAKQKATEES